MSTQNAIGIRIEEGSNANGRWLRVGNTLQQWSTVTVTFQATTSLSGTATFPVAFGAGGSAIRVSLSLRDGLPNSAPSVQQISCLFTNTTPTTTSVGVAIFRINGQTNFASGNTALIDVMATGPAP